jgi:hypothetical protein
LKLDTFGVNGISLCHLPPGWKLTAGRFSDPSGTLDAEASLGVSWLDRDRWTELDGLFHVEIDDYRKTDRPTSGGGSLPASFKETLTLGTYGADPVDWREIVIKPSNATRKPAERCP